MQGLWLSWQVWALGAAVFAALTAILAKLGVEDVDSDLATFVRTAVVLALTGAIALSGRAFEGAGALSTRNLIFLTLSGLATGASWLCYFRALNLGEASRVAPVDKLSVVFVALLGALLLGERLTPLQWAGVGLIAAGAMLLARPG
ncbi:MAG: EamA family transporter [Pseudomonadota bacterium]